MKNKRVDQLIPHAYKAIQNNKISNEDDSVLKAYRSKISQFAVSANGGTILSAICFYNHEKANEEKVNEEKVNGAKTNGKYLLGALYDILCDVGEIKKEGESGGGKDKATALYEYAKKNSDCKDRILEAAAALKLAMNLYKLVDSDQKR